MKSTVKKWGNSAAVRIPKSVMQATHLHLDEVVDVQEDGGRIIIQPVRQSTYDLDDLLKRIKGKAAREGRALQDVANELLRNALVQQKPKRNLKLKLRGWKATVQACGSAPRCSASTLPR